MAPLACAPPQLRLMWPEQGAGGLRFQAQFGAADGKEQGRQGGV
jgi:hypothetical protein